MSQQLSVQSQNRRTRARIEEVATWFTQAHQPAAWLSNLLQERGVSPNAGILVDFDEIPEQEGNLCKGIWLSDSHQFWRFEAFVSRSGLSGDSVEYFRDITPELPVNAHIPGIGKSFGLLAIEVLEGDVDG